MPFNEFDVVLKEFKGFFFIMVHHKITEHREYCKIQTKLQKEKLENLNESDPNIEFNKSLINIGCGGGTSFILMVKGTFHIVEMSNCFNSLDFKLEIIKEILSTIKSKQKIFYKVKRSISDYENWKNEAKRELLYNNKHYEINYAYYDNRKKEYYFTTEYDFASYLINLNDFEIEYKKTKKYLIENSLNYLLYELDNLYHLNSLPYQLNHNKDVIIHKTINEFVKNINQN